VIGRYFQYQPLIAWLYGNAPKLTFGMTVQDLKRLPVSNFRVKIAALGCLKRVTESILKLVSNFKGAS
jgi:hypothetical protein